MEYKIPYENFIMSIYCKLELNHNGFSQLSDQERQKPLNQTFVRTKNVSKPGEYFIRLGFEMRPGGSAIDNPIFGLLK